MTREEAIERLNIHKSTSVFVDSIAEAIDMAIEALSDEDEDRLYIKIYADDEPSVKAEKLYQICGETQNSEVAEWLKEYFPSAEAEQEWIPCSERLPKENEYVGNVCKYYLIQDEYGDMHVAHLSSRGWETIDSVKALGCDVIAWMPLPTPYKGGNDE